MAGDWYESAIVLYVGTPPATLSHTIADVHVVRGKRIAEFKTETFSIPLFAEDNDNYFVGFYAGSYDHAGSEVLGASIEFGEVSVSF